MMTCDFEGMSEWELHAVSYAPENTTVITGKSLSDIIFGPSFVDVG